MGGASKLLMVLPTRFPHPCAALRFAPRYLVPVPALSSSVSFRQCRYFLPFLPRLVRQGFFYIPSMQVHTNSTCAWEGYVDAMTSTAPDLNASVHPWPEWSKLVDLLVSLGYYDRQASATVPIDDDDSFSAREDLTDEFARAAQACLSFARDRPDFLRMLAKNDIEIITENSSPFLFRNGANSVRRLKAFVNADATNVLESESAQTVDIMRYLLSNACVSTSNHNQSITSRNLIEASTRRLFAELVRLNNVSSDLKSPGLNPGQTSTKHGQFLSPGGQNIEMKRGDWICPKCSFMNFARNMKCLECGETRPKRVVAGGEWECPQCDFFNYSRNMSCLRCDCKRPGESPINAAPSDAYGKSLNIGQILNGSGLDKSEIEKKLAANDEKAERWFSKISQLGDSADLSNAVDDEDFPEIMPMRKGVNRFVVSTRKTPLERRLANAQNKFNLADSSSSDARESQPGKASEISQMLDRILGRSSNSAGMNHPVANGGNNSELGNKFDSSDSRQGIANGKTDPYNVPPVSSPACMSNANNERSSYLEDSSLIKTSQLSDPVLKDFESTTESKDTSSFDASKRWSKEATELDTNKDVTKAISDDDFPEIMPMRRGENRFVVSNKKERTIISPQYKRRIAMEQANSSNFVPFVPFPPDYFAKKEHKQSEASPAGISSSEGRLHSTDQSSGVSATQSAANWSSNQNTSENSNTGSYMTHLDNHNMGAFSNGTPTTSPQLPSHTQNNQSQTWSNRSQSNTRSDPTVSANSHQTENSRSVNEGWKPRFSGKSLEGSAVTEPDPLDMSEEAKAARWFRRAAQIKDISELSNIPDEDFPEIMPMRKGVNRFVVSKRKTPLERRLTSPQYRRNLPIISSDPEKDSN